MSDNYLVASGIFTYLIDLGRTARYASPRFIGAAEKLKGSYPAQGVPPGPARAKRPPGPS
jgi:hypothetical protein